MIQSVVEDTAARPGPARQVVDEKLMEELITEARVKRTGE